MKKSIDEKIKFEENKILESYEKIRKYRAKKFDNGTGWNYSTPDNDLVPINKTVINKAD